MEDNVHERQQVSPAQSTFAGLAAFVGGTSSWQVFRRAEQSANSRCVRCLFALHRCCSSWRSTLCDNSQASRRGWHRPHTKSQSHACCCKREGWDCTQSFLPDTRPPCVLDCSFVPWACQPLYAQLWEQLAGLHSNRVVLAPSQLWRWPHCMRQLR